MITESPRIRAISPTIIERYSQLITPPDPDMEDEDDNNVQEEAQKIKSEDADSAREDFGFDLKTFLMGHLAHCIASLAILVVYSFVVLGNASQSCKFDHVKLINQVTSSPTTNRALI